MLTRTQEETVPQTSKNMDYYSQNGHTLEELVEDILELYNELC